MSRAVSNEPGATIQREPGYCRIYGETTKHAPEASVFTVTMPSKSGWDRGRSRSEWVRLDVPHSWMRQDAFGAGRSSTTQPPASPGVERAA